jgi:hypothetical protein
VIRHQLSAKISQTKVEFQSQADENLTVTPLGYKKTV